MKILLPLQKLAFTSKLFAVRLVSKKYEKKYETVSVYIVLWIGEYAIVAFEL